MALPPRLPAIVVLILASGAWAQLGPVTITAGARQVTVIWSSPAAGLTEVAWGPASAPGFASYPNRLTLPGTTGDHSATIRRLAPGTWFVRARTGGVESPEQQVVVPAGDGLPLVDWAFDRQVSAAVRLGSSWYVGGYFSWVGQTTGGGVPTTFDGGLNPHFPEVAGQVFALEPDGVGGLYLGGSFSSVGGLRRSNVAHLRADLGVDPDFAPSCDGPVYAIHRGPASVYLAGMFRQVNGQTRTSLAEVSLTGALQSWAPTPLGAVFALDGAGPTLYAGGTFSAINGQARECLAAIGVDGGVQAWNPLMTNGCWVTGVSVSGPAIYVNGSFDTVAGEMQRGVAALDNTANLLPWRPLLGGATVFVKAVVPSAQGVFLGGSFTSVGGQARPGLALVDVDGGQPAPWIAPIDGGTIEGLASDGNRLFVVGNIVGRAASYSTTTGAPLSWSPPLNGLPRKVTIVPTAVFVGGDFTGLAQTARAQLAAINASTGALEPWSPTLAGGTFGPHVNALAGSGNQLVVGGSFSQVNSSPRGNAAMITSTGNPVLTWDPNVNGEVNAIALAPGLVLIGGSFDRVNGLPRGNGAILGATSGQPVGVDPGLSPGNVTGIAVEGQTSYWVGGFGQTGATARGHAAAFDLQSNTLQPWDPSVATSIDSVHVVGGSVVLGGPFQFVNGWGGPPVDRQTLAVVDRDAGALNGPNFKIASTDVHALTSADSTLFAGGGLLTDAGLVIAADLSSGQVRGFDVRGQSDLFLRSNVEHVYGLGLDCSSGKLAAAGLFHALGLTPAGGLAAIDIACGDAGARVDGGSGADAGADSGVATLDGGVMSDGGLVDSGVVDTDGGQADGGANDSGVIDAGLMDAGLPVVDAGLMDAGLDAGPTADGGPIVDAGPTPDGGGPDGDAGARADGGSDGGAVRVTFAPVSCGCSGGDAFPAVLLALPLLTRKRR